jgi:hypothetical protein
MREVKVKTGEESQLQVREMVVTNPIASSEMTLSKGTRNQSNSEMTQGSTKTRKGLVVK